MKPNRSQRDLDLGEVDATPGALKAAERGHRLGVRDQVDAELVAVDVVHRQADAVDRDRGLLLLLCNGRLGQQAHPHRARVLVQRHQLADAVDVARDQVAAEQVPATAARPRIRPSSRPAGRRT